jgi:hypothetical protein
MLTPKFQALYEQAMGIGNMAPKTQPSTSANTPSQNTNNVDTQTQSNPNKLNTQSNTDTDEDSATSTQPNEDEVFGGLFTNIVGKIRKKHSIANDPEFKEFTNQLRTRSKGDQAAMDGIIMGLIQASKMSPMAQRGLKNELSQYLR